MNQSSPTIDPAVYELAVGCAVAHTMLSSSQSAADAKTIQLLKSHLVRAHRRHLEQLSKHGFLHPRAKLGRRAHHCSDLASALRSSNDGVVVGACGLLERALLAAYDRTLALDSIDSRVRRVLRRQRHDLKCHIEYYICRFPAWDRRDRPGRARAPRPFAVLGEAA